MSTFIVTGRDAAGEVVAYEIDAADEAGARAEAGTLVEKIEGVMSAEAAAEAERMAQELAAAKGAEVAAAKQAAEHEAGLEGLGGGKVLSIAESMEASGLLSEEPLEPLREDEPTSQELWQKAGSLSMIYWSSLLIGLMLVLAEFFVLFVMVLPARDEVEKLRNDPETRVTPKYFELAVENRKEAWFWFYGAAVLGLPALGVALWAKKKRTGTMKLYEETEKRENAGRVNPELM